ncbi:uncharacterized protein LOC126370091 isoform X2 [Pectinophora gossypiella]|nr:uncharacterized protein LOC126370091 isoform X2 [Pectinophora gossypiella]
MKLKLENSIIGQGDEEIDTSQNELSTSTSMFINNLFDMSEVENEVSCEEVTAAVEVTEIVNNDTSMMSIMDELFHIAFDIASGHDDDEVQAKENCKSAEESCYSFLEDAYDDDSQDVAFYIDNSEMPPVNDSKGLECGDMPCNFAKLISLQLNEEEKLEKSNVARFENAYLSLNRDYDQCSDDGDPILQDPKGLLMQDVELLTASTSDENLSSRRASENARKQLAAVSGVSGVSGSRKSRGSLVSRCRSQGARLLACLRGWWRRKTPGKRKEGRAQGSIRGMCPLSPDARRRAASLLDSRQMYASGVPHSVVWKFNTVNEALVNSSRWKEYTFEGKPENCGEY